jgi:hypothetical protein
MICGFRKRYKLLKLVFRIPLNIINKQQTKGKKLIFGKLIWMKINLSMK